MVQGTRRFSLPRGRVASSRGKQKRERQTRGYHMSGGFREWTVYLPFGNNDTIWALLTVPSLLALYLSTRGRRENPRDRCLVAPLPSCLCTASLQRAISTRSSPSFFLTSFVDSPLPSPTPTSVGTSSSFFFGSTTVPLAARESPLTRRMDDLRISSRSLSLVRSRYRRHPSAHLRAALSSTPPALPPFFFHGHGAASTGFPRRTTRAPRVLPSYRRHCLYRLLCRDAVAALTNE